MTSIRALGLAGSFVKSGAILRPCWAEPAKPGAVTSRTMALTRRRRRSQNDLWPLLVSAVTIALLNFIACAPIALESLQLGLGTPHRRSYRANRGRMLVSE